MPKRRRDKADHTQEERFVADLHDRIDKLLAQEQMWLAQTLWDAPAGAWDKAFATARDYLHEEYARAARIAYEWYADSDTHYYRCLLLQCAKHSPFLIRFEEPPVLEARERAQTWIEQHRHMHTLCLAFHQVASEGEMVGRGRFPSWMRTYAPDVSTPDDFVSHYLWCLNGPYETVHVIPDGNGMFRAETALYAPLCSLDAAVQIEPHDYAPFAD